MKKVFLILFLAIAVSGCTSYALEVAEVAYKQGDYPMAISHAKIARKASSNNSPEELRSLYILARSYEASGDLNSATYVYNMILQSYPNSQEAVDARRVIAK